MKKIFAGLFLIAATLFLLSEHANAQAVYGPQGQYQGYVQTSPNGVTTTYNQNGVSQGSFQTDNNQTSFYGPTGAYQGTSTAPIYVAPNSNFTVPRQVPQVPVMRGW